MATVILRTTAGAAYDLAVRNGTAPQSPLKHIVLHTGAAVTDVIAIMALIALPGVEGHRFTYDPDGGINSFAITEETPTSTRYVAHLSATVGNGKTFTGIAMLLENGTLWGYAPYLPDGGGLTKTLAMTWDLDLLVVEGNAQMLSVSYEPLDYRAIRERLMEGFELAKADLLREVFCAGLKSPPFGEVYDCSGALNLTDTDITGIAAPTF